MFGRKPWLLRFQAQENFPKEQEEQAGKLRERFLTFLRESGTDDLSMAVVSVGCETS